MTEVLNSYPATPLKDMTLFWLANASYKTGNLYDAGRYMAQFLKEHPDSSLKPSVDDKMATLAAKYQRGELVADRPASISTATPQPAAPVVTEQEKAQAAKAETDRIAREKAEQEKALAAKAEVDRIAREKAEQEQALAAKAETKRIAKELAEQDKARTARAETAATEAETRPAGNAALREQAISEYKRVIARYPGTQAAKNAAARLKSLGAESAKTVATAAPREENTRILSLEVAQVAELELSIPAELQTVEAGRKLTLPFELVNRGNSADSFIFESGFPADYRARFLAAAAPDQPLVNTPKINPGERFKGLLQLDMPTMATDGERRQFSVRAFSESDAAASQSRAVRLMAKAPLLRALIKTDVTQVKPGEQVPYTLVLLNVGSAPVTDLTLRLTYPPQYEPVNPGSAGLKAEGSGILLLTGLRLNAGESKEVNVTMKLRESTLSKEELFLRAEMINTVLDRTDSFIAAAVSVKEISNVAVKASTDKITVVPGQTATVSLVVTNSGNGRDGFSVRPAMPAGLKYAFYLDSNRDGIHQANEAKIEHLGPLAPKESAHLVLEIASESAMKDGAASPLAVAFISDADTAVKAAANINLVYSRPVISLSMMSKGPKVKPGEVASFELSCVNTGSGMAKAVNVRSFLPEQLELLASEPTVSKTPQGEYIWRFDDLGAGEQRNIKVSYRIRPGTPVGTALELKNTLTYQDQIGNSY
jgi:uncharacterized membrane protein